VARYYFDVKDGVRLADACGLDCRDDIDAENKAEIIAQQLALDAPPTTVPRYIAVLDEEHRQIATVPVGGLAPIPK
jgi:hypothetical protein